MWRRCCLDINQSTVFESYPGSPVIQPKYSNTEGPEQPVPAGWGWNWFIHSKKSKQNWENILAIETFKLAEMQIFFKKD